MSDKSWAHLPNARHIDAVLADAKARPEAWRDVWGTAPENVRSAAWLAAENANDYVWEHLWCMSLGSGTDEVCMEIDQAKWTTHTLAIPGTMKGSTEQADQAAVRSTVLDAAIALSVWDASAALLECTPDVLRTMVDLAEPPVCHQATLLLPYAIVRSNDK